MVTAERLADGSVRLDMGVPEFEPARIPFTAERAAERYAIEVAGARHEIGAVALGNPHAVLEVEDTGRAPVETLGPALERHARFPERCNVGFAQVLAPDSIRLRVFERGVGETLACGSGACAAVAILRRRGRVGDAVRVALPGGTLAVSWAGDDAHRCSSRARPNSYTKESGSRDGTGDTARSHRVRSGGVPAPQPGLPLGFPELAFVLTIPREHGASTTLASYQLEVLRDKNRAMHRRLNELVAIAQENEQLMVRVHAFTLALMRAASAAETLERTCAVLSEDFQGDLVRLVLFGANTAAGGALAARARARRARAPAVRRVPGRGRAAVRAPAAGEAHAAVRVRRRARALGRAAADPGPRHARGRQPRRQPLPPWHGHDVPQADVGRGGRGADALPAARRKLGRRGPSPTSASCRRTRGERAVGRDWALPRIPPGRAPAVAAHALRPTATTSGGSRPSLEAAGVSEWTAVDGEHLRTWAAAEHRAGRAGKTVARRLSASRSLFRWLIREGLARQNPASGVRAPRSGRKLPNVLDATRWARSSSCPRAPRSRRATAPCWSCSIRRRCA
jgi:hypothetical protein